ncbi:uncharacterized protein LOC124419811 [Lucilia cuprina]|uniref:uncharacterized protein LOC124419811 n=1 Tax=Lucilia cuprina TaxID=7375 RepID=UPI001F0525E3|nr:uncharacterized protein LOC124419811 [Lucilia cuprina]
MPQKTIIQCPACKANVTKSVGSIGCGVCGSYFHPKCSGIPENTYAAIRKNHSTFVCKSCSNTADPQNTTGNDDLIKRIEQIQKSIEDKLEHNKSEIKSEIELQMNNGFANLEAKMDGLIENVRSEMRGELNKMKSDVNNCYSMVKEVDKSTNAKINALVAKNNTLERRLNRADILIIGLPNKMDSIRSYVMKIGQLVGVAVTMTDINHCCYLKKQKCILIKFNSVYIRDSIMKKYYESQPLLLKDVMDNCDVGGADKNGVGDQNVGGDVESRIYLKDNLSPVSKRLKYICQKLLLKKQISKFYLKNMDNPKAKIFKSDGSFEYLDIQQCADLLDGCQQGEAMEDNGSQNNRGKHQKKN